VGGAREIFEDFSVRTFVSKKAGNQHGERRFGIVWEKGLRGMSWLVSF
jgi:hypothetical protein